MPTQLEGFTFSGIHCGLKSDGKKDIALIVSDRPCTVAGVFTTNRVKAAPVLYDQKIVASGNPVRAVIANSGGANACTGELGKKNNLSMATHTAEAIGCKPEEVLVLSTGVIGIQLPMDLVDAGIHLASGELSEDGIDEAALGIMTTDTVAKQASVVSDAGYTVSGIAKGSGMIAPNMATMLSVIVTDADVPRPLLDNLLKSATETSFNSIVVDGDMSTNDTVLVLANGSSGVTIEGDEVQQFADALTQVCEQLARAIVKDAEGATKFVHVMITGAAGEASARDVGRAIATSPLCKTAFYGADPNWGRFLCAAGYADVDFNPNDIALWMDDLKGQEIQLVGEGQPLDYDEPAAIKLMEAEEWGVRLDLGVGTASAILWTCDLSHEYVTINGHYRT